MRLEYRSQQECMLCSAAVWLPGARRRMPPNPSPQHNNTQVLAEVVAEQLGGACDCDEALEAGWLSASATERRRMR